MSTKNETYASQNNYTSGYKVVTISQYFLSLKEPWMVYAVAAAILFGILLIFILMIICCWACCCRKKKNEAKKGARPKTVSAIVRGDEDEDLGFGLISYSLEYIEDKKCLNLKIEEGENIMNDPEEPINPYVLANLVTMKEGSQEIIEDKQKTPVRNNTAFPMYGNKLSFPVDNFDEIKKLTLEVYDYRNLGDDLLIGTIDATPKRESCIGKIHQANKAIISWKNPYSGIGQVKIILIYDPAIGKLRLSIVEAHHLRTEKAKELFFTADLYYKGKRVGKLMTPKREGVRDPYFGFDDAFTIKKQAVPDCYVIVSLKFKDEKGDKYCYGRILLGYNGTDEAAVNLWKEMINSVDIACVGVLELSRKTLPVDHV